MNKDTGKYMVILPFKCNRGEKISWDSSYQAALNGLKPNSKVIAYSHEGKSVHGTLGSPMCFLGACSANYIALPLSTDASIEQVAVISKPQPFDIAHVERAKSEECVNIPSNHEHPYGFNFASLPTRCENVTWDGPDELNHGQLVSFGWRQSNGWDVFHSFFRSVSYSAENEKKYGDLQEVSYSTSRQYPIFGFSIKGMPASLLWYEKMGLGPVSFFTLRESNIDSNGDVKWKSEYNAGGQPCD